MGLGFLCLWVFVGFLVELVVVLRAVGGGGCGCDCGFLGLLSVVVELGIGAGNGFLGKEMLMGID